MLIELRFQFPVQCQTLGEIPLGIRFPPQRLSNHPPVFISDCETRVDGDVFVIVGDSALKIPFGMPNHTAVVPGFTQAQIELDGLVVVFNGQIWVSPILAQGVAIVVGNRQSRVKLDRAVLIGQSRFVIALGIMCHSAIVIGHSIVAIDRDRSPVTRYLVGATKIFVAEGTGYGGARILSGVAMPAAFSSKSES